MELMMKKVKLKIIKFQKKMKISVILILKMIIKEMFQLKTKIHNMDKYLLVTLVLNCIIKECFHMVVQAIKKLLLNYLRQKMENID